MSKCSIEQKILCICACQYNNFLSKSNVLGLGLGYKVKNGILTNEKCIKVFVSNKIPSNELPEQDLVPSIYNGIQTDVMDSGNLTSYSLTKRVRPVTGGYSISPVSGSTGGTMGCLVTDGKYYYLLSNNHTLVSEDKTPIGMPIIQPAIEDGGHYPEDEIATLTKYIPIKFIATFKKPENFVDCAMAKITKRSQVSTKITYLGRIKGTSFAEVAEDVQKVGRTTGLTKGVILSIGSTCIFTTDEGKYLLKNQIFTTKMSDEGDSGSVLLDNKVNAIGLVVGGSNSTCICTPIDAVLKSLNVTIVTG